MSLKGLTYFNVSNILDQLKTFKTYRTNLKLLICTNLKPKINMRIKHAIKPN